MIINIAKLTPIASVIEGKNRPNDRPRFFDLLLQINSRPDLTNMLCILSFSNYSDATGGFVYILFT